MEVTQVVKRFGPVGGMEECVFRLSEELAQQGTAVTVLCESDESAGACENIRTVQLSGSRAKPRWFSHFRFSSKVSDWLLRHPSETRLVHSHERQRDHHITTIYSTLYDFPKKTFRLKTPRSFANEYLERRELHAKQTKAIVPLSSLVAQQIESKHPGCIAKLRPPITPGVTSSSPRPASSAPRNGSEKTLGFMGREWRRKGLPKVIEIWRVLSQDQPKLRLHLAGFPIDTPLGLTESERQRVELRDWVTDKPSFFNDLDLLLHPARLEAYGMVVAEAMAMQVPVLCSRECGAADDVHEGFGAVIGCDASVSKWAKTASSLLDGERPPHPFERPWKQVADEYLTLYQEVASGNAE